jgi:predicted DCC family thiol-disulfide oxidoreductase YuxK
MRQVIPISRYQFAVFRVIFGLYLCQHFAGLLPYGAELFSREGVLPDSRLNFTHGLLPNPLEHWDSPAFVLLFLWLLLGLAVSFTLGIGSRVCALLLWYGWACLFHRNNLISNPSLPYVGLLLLFCALLPPLKQWRFPAAVFWVAWILLAAGYTFSGCVKLFSPSWLDGTAMLHVVNNPLARPGIFRDLFLASPLWMSKSATWGSLAIEVLFLPLCLHRRTRLWAWSTAAAMHLGILLMIDFADLSFGMLMFHLFVFDPRWLPARAPQSALVLYDGVCGLCDRSVQFFLEEDAGRTLRFAPLQGETTRQRSDVPADLRSLVFIANYGGPGEKIYFRSDAVLRALNQLGGFWRVVSWLRIVPRLLRDAVYNAVAARRYRWFGKFDACRLPTPESRPRFLP